LTEYWFEPVGIKAMATRCTRIYPGLDNTRQKVKSEYFFIVAAFISFVFSVTLWFIGDTDLNRQQAIFVGIWVPSILSFGNLFGNLIK
jgi:hypothetical protein